MTRLLSFFLLFLCQITILPPSAKAMAPRRNGEPRCFDKFPDKCPEYKYLCQAHFFDIKSCAATCGLCDGNGDFVLDVTTAPPPLPSTQRRRLLVSPRRRTTTKPKVIAEERESVTPTSVPPIAAAKRRESFHREWNILPPRTWDSQDALDDHKRTRDRHLWNRPLSAQTPSVTTTTTLKPSDAPNQHRRFHPRIRQTLDMSFHPIQAQLPRVRPEIPDSLPHPRPPHLPKNIVVTDKMIFGSIQTQRHHRQPPPHTTLVIEERIHQLSATHPTTTTPTSTTTASAATNKPTTTPTSTSTTTTSTSTISTAAQTTTVTSPEINPPLPRPREWYYNSQGLKVLFPEVRQLSKTEVEGMMKQFPGASDVVSKEKWSGARVPPLTPSRLPPPPPPQRTLSPTIPPAPHTATHPSTPVYARRPNPAQRKARPGAIGFQPQSIAPRGTGFQVPSLNTQPTTIRNDRRPTTPTHRLPTTRTKPFTTSKTRRRSSTASSTRRIWRANGRVSSHSGFQPPPIANSRRLSPTSANRPTPTLPFDAMLTKGLGGGFSLLVRQQRQRLPTTTPRLPEIVERIVQGYRDAISEAKANNNKPKAAKFTAELLTLQRSGLAPPIPEVVDASAKGPILGLESDGAETIQLVPVSPTHHVPSPQRYRVQPRPADYDNPTTMKYREANSFIYWPQGRKKVVKAVDTKRKSSNIRRVPGTPRPRALLKPLPLPLATAPSDQQDPATTPTPTSTQPTPNHGHGYIPNIAFRVAEAIGHSIQNMKLVVNTTSAAHQEAMKAAVIVPGRDGILSSTATPSTPSPTTTTTTPATTATTTDTTTTAAPTTTTIPTTAYDATTTDEPSSPAPIVIATAHDVATTTHAPAPDFTTPTYEYYYAYENYYPQQYQPPNLKSLMAKYKLQFHHPVLTTTKKGLLAPARLREDPLPLTSSPVSVSLTSEAPSDRTTITLPFRLPKPIRTNAKTNPRHPPLVPAQLRKYFMKLGGSLDVVGPAEKPIKFAPRDGEPDVWIPNHSNPDAHQVGIHRQASIIGAKLHKPAAVAILRKSNHPDS